MKGKLILALLIIFGLLGFGYYHGYFEKFNLPIQPSDLVGNFLVWMEELIFGKSQIPILANLTLASFDGKEILFRNSSFSFNGQCTSFIDLNGILINQKNNACDFNIKSSEGRIWFKGKEVKVEVKTNKLDFNNSQYFGDLKLTFSAIPSKVKIGKLSQTLSFKRAWGEIKKLKADGKVDQIKILYGNRLELRNFEGSLVIEETQVLLIGKASKLEW